MPRPRSTVPRRRQREVPARIDRAPLNDLFKLFPELPGFQRRAVYADQRRRVLENIARMQRRAAENIARHRAAAAQVKAAWLAKLGRR
jgi:hypothetical protein